MTNRCQLTEDAYKLSESLDSGLAFSFDFFILRHTQLPSEKALKLIGNAIHSIWVCKETLARKDALNIKDVNDKIKIKCYKSEIFLSFQTNPNCIKVVRDLFIGTNDYDGTCDST